MLALLFDWAGFLLMYFVIAPVVFCIAIGRLNEWWAESKLRLTLLKFTPNAMKNRWRRPSKPLLKTSDQHGVSRLASDPNKLDILGGAAAEIFFQNRRTTSNASNGNKTQLCAGSPGKSSGLRRSSKNGRETSTSPVNYANRIKWSRSGSAQAKKKQMAGVAHSSPHEIPVDILGAIEEGPPDRRRSVVEDIAMATSKASRQAFIRRGNSAGKLGGPSSLRRAISVVPRMEAQRVDEILDKAESESRKRSIRRAETKQTKTDRDIDTNVKTDNIKVAAKQDTEKTELERPTSAPSIEKIKERAMPSTSAAVVSGVNQTRRVVSGGGGGAGGAGKAASVVTNVKQLWGEIGSCLATGTSVAGDTHSLRGNADSSDLLLDELLSSSNGTNEHVQTHSTDNAKDHNGEEYEMEETKRVVRSALLVVVLIAVLGLVSVLLVLFGLYSLGNACLVEKVSFGGTTTSIERVSVLEQESSTMFGEASIFSKCSHWAKGLQISASQSGDENQTKAMLSKSFLGNYISPAMCRQVYRILDPFLIQTNRALAAVQCVIGSHTTSIWHRTGILNSNTGKTILEAGRNIAEYVANIIWYALEITRSNLFEWWTMRLEQWSTTDENDVCGVDMHAEVCLADSDHRGLVENVKDIAAHVLEVAEHVLVRLIKSNEYINDEEEEEEEEARPMWYMRWEVYVLLWSFAGILFPYAKRAVRLRLENRRTNKLLCDSPTVRRLSDAPAFEEDRKNEGQQQQKSEDFSRRFFDEEESKIPPPPPFGPPPPLGATPNQNQPALQLSNTQGANMPAVNTLNNEIGNTPATNDNHATQDEFDTNQKQSDQRNNTRTAHLNVDVNTPDPSVSDSTHDSSMEEDDIFRCDNNNNNNNNRKLFSCILAQQASSSSFLHSPSGLSSVSMNSALSAFVNEEEMEMRRALAEQRRNKKLQLACEKAVSDLHLAHPTMSEERQRAARAEVEASMKSVMARVAARRALRLSELGTHSVL